jgi:class 3 adenylate cyclase
VTTTGGRLERARAAYARHDWQEAFDELHASDADAPLGADDLELLASSAGYLGRADWNRLIERALDAYATADDRRGAARMALELARNHVLAGEDSVGIGWWMRARRFLDGEPECPELAMATWMESRAYMQAGDIELAEELARLATEMARRTGARDAEAHGLCDQGHYRLGRGEVREAFALLDEATALAVSGSVQPSTAGSVLCGMIWACRNVGDLRRAAQWTDVSVEYCERDAGYYYPGLCRVHRAELVRLRGEYDAAEQDILEACDQLLARHRSIAGWAFQELGEVRLRRGDFSGAMEAFKRAIELGVEPQPGLARLRHAQGDAAGALRTLERVLADATLGVDALLTIENRPYLLPALVSVAIAAGDLDRARSALQELESLGPLVESRAHRAALHASRGELALAEGRTGDAVPELRRATQAWSDVDAPYEAAQARVLLGRAYEAEGDFVSARLELDAAIASFERLGARTDATQARARLAAAPGERAERAERTFMFTDIVDSTKLVELLGDDAWSELLQWHDRTLRACFDEFRGEEIKHEGDGFFVAFASPAAAIECAVSVQRVLADHRREHGFAPRVRIGVHEAEANRHLADYAGRGVHASARIAAAAGADEILVSVTTLGDDHPFPASETRSLSLKGFAEPIDARTIDWRA